MVSSPQAPTELPMCVELTVLHPTALSRHSDSCEGCQLQTGAVRVPYAKHCGLHANVHITFEPSNVSFMLPIPLLHLGQGQSQ